jgi:hypothetical protein
MGHIISEVVVVAIKELNYFTNWIKDLYFLNAGGQWLFW